jgi:hypothetical protein
VGQNGADGWALAHSTTEAASGAPAWVTEGRRASEQHQHGPDADGTARGRACLHVVARATWQRCSTAAATRWRARAKLRQHRESLRGRDEMAQALGGARCRWQRHRALQRLSARGLARSSWRLSPANSAGDECWRRGSAAAATSS